MSRETDLELKILEVGASADFVSIEMIVERISRPDIDRQTVTAAANRLIADGKLEHKWVGDMLWIRRRAKRVSGPKGSWSC